MSTFNITSSSLNNQYTFVNTSVSVSGAYSLNAEDDSIINISGQVYSVDQEGNVKDYIGQFNGYMRNGEICYTLSEMTHEKALIVWNAISEIEDAINGENE